MSFAACWGSLFDGPNDNAPALINVHDTNASTAHASPSSRLGIDFVTASAPRADIGAGITLEQDLTRFGIAGVIWDSARAMVGFFQHHSELVAGKRVLELGAGTGAVGLALACSIVSTSVILTDLPGVTQLTTRNRELLSSTHPQVSGLTRVLPLSWGTDDVQAVSSDEGVDVVLCSDCLYDPAVYAPLLKTLEALTDHDDPPKSASTVDVFIGYKQRHPDRERAFFAQAATIFSIDVWTGPLELGVAICRLRRHKSPSACA